jgi:hypothetical protein
MISPYARLAVLCFCFIVPALVGEDAATVPQGPHLVRGPKSTQLYVKGLPFLVLGGEVRNSSSSSLDYMLPVWPRLASRHLNTVLVPVTWEQLEPDEGKFDFDLVDGLINGARENRLHLILLWFGSWKNMVSSYAPRWVRGDPRRFPLTVDDAGNWLPVPSTFGENTREADARAFGALMRHLRQFDAAEQTVVMVQVENEVGLPDSARDRSAAAQAAFAAPLPGELAGLLANHPDQLTRELSTAWKAAGARTSGSWAEVFGNGPLANELFMAWHYARYIDSVAAAGRAGYPVPLFVNAAIGRKNGLIGSYPGGGALPSANNLWHLAAPNIDILSPDIYYGSFTSWCDAYSQLGNPFFIPETNGGEVGSANAFLAIGRWNALGFSPFAIDDPAPTDDQLARAYKILGQLGALILAHQGDGSMNAVIVDKDNPEQALAMGGYILHIARRIDRKASTVADHGYALVIAERPDRFIVAGKDVQVTFDAASETGEVVELDRVEDGNFIDGKWVPGRRLNGDETMLNYSLSELAANNRTGTGLRLGPDGPEIICASVFRRESSQK